MRIRVIRAGWPDGCRIRGEEGFYDPVLHLGCELSNLFGLRLPKSDKHPCLPSGRIIEYNFDDLGHELVAL